MFCSIGFEPTKRRCSQRVLVFFASVPYALAEIDTQAFDRVQGGAHRDSMLGDGPTASSVALFCMLSGSFLFAMIVLFCTLRLRCMERRRPLPKAPSKKKVITEEEADRRCPATPCTAAAENAETTTCVVCLVAIEDGELCRELQCGHTFHAECIMSWWMYKPRKSIRCPLCRSKQRKPTAKPHCAFTKDLEAQHHEEEDGLDGEDLEQPDLVSSEMEPQPTLTPTLRAGSRADSGDEATSAPGCLGSAEVGEDCV